MDSPREGDEYARTGRMEMRFAGAFPRMGETLNIHTTGGIDDESDEPFDGIDAGCIVDDVVWDLGPGAPDARVTVLATIRHGRRRASH